MSCLFRRLQILVGGKEKSVIASYHVFRWDRMLLCWLTQKQADKVQWALQRHAGAAKQSATRRHCCCDHLLLTWRNK